MQPQRLDRELERRVLEHWSALLDVDIDSLDHDGFIVVSDPRDVALGRRATMRTARGTLLLAAERDVDAASAEPSGFVADVAARATGIGLFHYCTAAPVREPDPRISVLGDAHRPQLNALQRRAGAAAAEEAEVGVDDPLAVGILDGDRLLAIASLLEVGTSAVDVGVLVDPALRGRGLGRAVVSDVVRRAASAHLLVQYRCRSENRASARLALACGFVLWGALTIAPRGVG